MNNKFLKLSTVKKFIQATEQTRKSLFQDLADNATDDVIFMRRFRMLSQIDQFESCAITKIYQFDTKDPEDYVRGLSILLHELDSVASKNA